MQYKTSLARRTFRHTLWYVTLCLLLTFSIALGIFTASTPRTATAATSSTMNFQARLLNSSGGIVPDGYYNVQFKLYDSSTSSGSGTSGCAGDASCKWTESYTQSNRVRVLNGYLTVNLGSITSFPNTINWDQEHWLTMNIGGTTNTASPSWDGEMTPRLKLTAVPYAFTAGKLQQTNGVNQSTLGFATQTASRNILLPDESGTVCIQGSTNCGFVTGSAGNFIQNGTTPQAASISIVGTSTTTPAAVIQAAAGGGSDAHALQVNKSNGTASFWVQGDGVTRANSALDVTNSAYNSRTSLTVTTTTANQLAAVFRGASGQTADILRVTDSSANVLAAFSAIGRLKVASATTYNGALNVGTNTTASDGGIYFGTDVNLYRGGDDTLQTNNRLNVGSTGLALTGANGTISKSYTKSGAVTQNDVVILVEDGGAKIATSTTPRDARILGVFRGGTENPSGSVAIVGNPIVNATSGVVVIGDQLVVSGEAGLVMVDNNATSGILGYATTAKSGGAPGVVGVRIEITNGASNPYYRTNDFRIQNASGTTDLFRVDGTSNRLAVGPAAIAANGVLTVGTDTTTSDGGLWFGADTGLYRYASNTLRTTGSLIVSNQLTTAGLLNATGAIISQRANDSDRAFDAQVLGDTQTRFRVSAGGQLAWGSGSVGVDTNLYRHAANLLQTDDSFNVLGALTQNGNNVCTVAGNCAGVGGTGDILQGGNSFGTAMNIGTNNNQNLNFKTNNNVVATLTPAGMLQLATQGATGGLQIGGDTSLYRSATNTLMTNSKFAVNNQLAVTVTDPATAALVIRVASGQTAQAIDVLDSANNTLFNIAPSGQLYAKYDIVSGSGRFRTFGTNLAGNTLTQDASFGSGVLYGAAAGTTGSATLSSGHNESSGNTGAVSVRSGNATSGNSGNVVVDAGTASGTTGTVSIGASNASAVTIGRSGINVSIQGASTTVGGNLIVQGAGTSTFAGSVSVAGGLNVTGAITSSLVVSAPNLVMNNTSLSGGYLGKYSVVGSGGVLARSVVVLNSSAHAVQTTNARDSRVYGVVGNTTDVAEGLTATIAVSGHATVNATSPAVAIGDQLVTSTEAGKVMVDNNATTGILGYATTAKAGGSAGTVGVRLQIVNGQTNPYYRTNDFRIQNASGTTDLFRVDGTSNRLAVGPAAIAANGVLTVGTDTTTSDGGLWFGSDVALYRNGDNKLRTNGQFVASGQVASTNTVHANMGNSSETIVGWVNGDRGAGITFGSDQDTNLYRSVANLLQTDDSFNVLGALTQGGTQVCLVSGNCAGVGGTGDILQGGNSFGTAMNIGTNNNQNLNFKTNNNVVATLTPAGMLQLATSDLTGGIQIGGDVHLHKAGTRILQSNSHLQVRRSGSTDIALSASVAGDSNARFSINANGLLAWGDGTVAAGTTLGVNSVGQLVANGLFSATQYVSSNGLYTAHNNSGIGVEFRSGMRDSAGNTGNAAFRSGFNTSTGNTGNVSLQSGNASGGNSGNIVVDAGTASGTAGTISVGTSATSSVTIGRSGITTTIQGTGSFTGSGTGLAVTNNATIGGTLTVTGATTLNGGLTVSSGYTINSLNNGVVFSKLGRFGSSDNQGATAGRWIKLGEADIADGAWLGFTGLEMDVYPRNGDFESQRQRLSFGIRNADTQLQIPNISLTTLEGRQSTIPNTIRDVKMVRTAGSGVTGNKVALWAQLGANQFITNNDATFRYVGNWTTGPYTNNRPSVASITDVGTQYGISNYDFANNLSIGNNLGIGTLSASHRLDVQGGNINTSGSLMTGGSVRITNTGVLQNVTADASILASGILDDARLNTNIARKDSNNNFTTSQTVTGTITATEFAGGGSGLTNLDADKVTSGKLNDARLNDTVAMLNRNNQIFMGNDQTFRNGTNSTSAFRIQNSGSQTLFNADTINQKINIGDNPTGNAKLNVKGSVNNLLWLVQGSVPESRWSAVTYGNGQFVAVNGDTDWSNSVMTSADGSSWVVRSGVSSSWSSITYGNGQFVAVAQSGTNRVMTSPDGINWTPRTAAEANQWSSITYGNGQFVAVAQSGTNRVMTSPDGINWTPRTAAEANQWSSITYGNGQFVAVAQSGTNRVMTSPDGATWTARSTPEISMQWSSITYGNGQFVAVANSGVNRIMTSFNGITWTYRLTPSYEYLYDFSSITYGNGQFVAVTSGHDSAVFSSDGVKWYDSYAYYSPNDWTSTAYGNGQFVAVSSEYSASPNQVMTSNGGAFYSAISTTGDVDVFGTIRQNGYEVCTTAGNCGSSIANILQSGNSFGTNMSLGTNDNFALQFKTDGTTRMTISNTGNATFTGTITVGDVSNGVVMSATTGVTFNGTARPTRSIVLSPEYAGATLSTDGSTNTLGSMTADNSGSSDGWKNYYTWTTSQATAQDYTVMVRVSLPADFDGWDASALAVGYRTGVSGTTNNSVSLLVNSTVSSPGTPMCSVSEAASTSWTTATCSAGSLTNWNSSNKTAVLRIKVKATNASNAMAQLGDITLQYKSKF